MVVQRAERFRASGSWLLRETSDNFTLQTDDAERGIVVASPCGVSYDARTAYVAVNCDDVIVAVCNGVGVNCKLCHNVDVFKCFGCW